MSESNWAFPRELQPKAGEVGFDLAAAFDAVVALRVAIPDDAFTAPILGTERTGNGVVIRGDGLVLTVGYLIPRPNRSGSRRTTASSLPGIRSPTTSSPASAWSSRSASSACRRSTAGRPRRIDAGDE